MKVEIDWGNVVPSDQEREKVERRLPDLPDADRPVVTLCRRGSGIEARLSLGDDGKPAVRLQDVDVAVAIERLVQLMQIVYRERRTAH